MSSPPVFNLTLTQLSADGRKAGLELPVLQRPGVSRKELRQLIAAAATVAPTVNYPLAPSIRVLTDAGQFIVNLKESRLQLVSWSSTLSPLVNPTVDQIVATISGEELEIGADVPKAAGRETHPSSGKGRKRILLAAVLVLGIAALNVFNFAQYRRRPPTFLPEYRLLDPEPASRLLGSIAGNYETGVQPGDRRLQINRDGQIVWIKYGAARAAAERRELTTQPVRTGTGDGLLTNRQAIISIKDPLTVVYFGDSYTRVTP